MGAAPERRFPLQGRNGGGPVPAPRNTDPMGTQESPEIAIVRAAPKAPAWHRSLWNLDTGFRGLMVLAALIVLGIVALIVIELMQRSSLAWHAFGFHFFVGSAWDPVSGNF